MKGAHELMCDIKYTYDINQHMYIKIVTNDCHVCLSKKTQYAMHYNNLEKKCLKRQKKL
jgi:hypothetical protein